jgi:indole-3-glycerol phosphate synthase
MTNILNELTTLRREDAELRKLQVSEAEMFRRARAAAPAPDFIAAFRDQTSPRIIAELKKASPSEGLIRADFEPRALALELVHAGAAALSVLCEPHRFLGSEAYLREAVQALAEDTAKRGAMPIPVLYKDFVTTSYQVAAARAAGASAVLLIVAALDDATLRELLRVVHDLGFAALVETHDADEIRRAVAAGARVIGVNCRDLRTFKTDPAIVERLIGDVPRECVRIAESGIRSAGDIARLRAAGADGSLVGTSLMRAARPGDALDALMGGMSGRGEMGGRG